MSSLGKHGDEQAWWRSLDELAQSPRFRAFVEAEFPAEADPGGISRRRWLQLMGASLALSAAGGCRWKKQEILPFAKRPAGYVPGKTERFCTAMPMGDVVWPLEVTTVDGRPIKIEGNPRHSESLGATSALAQAALLELYDPDRSAGVVFRETDRFREGTWEQFVQRLGPHFARLRQSGGEGFRVLAVPSSSVTIDVLRTRMGEVYPEAKWVEYEPIADDNDREGARLAFGGPVRTQVALDRARLIVCLDADLLGQHPAAVRHAREFASGRRAESGQMNRLYVAESGLSLTGAAADHRMAMHSGEIAALAAAIERELNASGNSGLATDPSRDREGAVSPPRESAPLPHGRGSEVARFARAIARDLLDPRNRGASVLCAGPGQSPEVHAAMHRMNARLGNVGEDRTVRYTQLPRPERLPCVEAIRGLAEEMALGKVGTLLILGGNPVYDAPADVRFADALARVETTIHLSVYRNETSRRCEWHLPEAHFLEAWGDGRAYDGTYSVIQPMIEPLRAGRPAIEVLSTVLAAATGAPVQPAETIVRRAYFERVDGSHQAAWEQTLREGLLAGSGWPSETVSAKAAEPRSEPARVRADGDGLEVVFRPDTSVYDGRFANNGWLQELPDPVTTMTWGNAAWLSPATARKHGIENETLVVVKLGDRAVRIPAYVMPGQAEGTIGLPLGYGRTVAGHVGGLLPEVEPVGVDVYPLRTTATMHVATGASIEPTGEPYRLACTQDHYAIDAVGAKARAERVETLIRQATLEHYREHPDFARHMVHHPPLESLWNEPKYQGHRWGMAIDLSNCIGCGACTVACQAENNVPVVGREQVLKGREMHWIRVDRYFRGDPENPEVAYQPVPCQQCEMAPCEQVCPVAATVHSREGLNDMVYNRCVGVRYCANNCPYKVRRFNFFNQHKDLEAPGSEIAKMKYNPQVTVRSRGVMEKCTYCVQRIQEARIAAKATGKQIADEPLQTACQQVCPARAIEFGDLADESSLVSQWHGSPRAYAILAELNTKPRTVYLARIRNPNPELESMETEHGDPVA